MRRITALFALTICFGAMAAPKHALSKAKHINSAPRIETADPEHTITVKFSAYYSDCKQKLQEFKERLETAGKVIIYSSEVCSGDDYYEEATIKYLKY